ncbi:helix-turn-helix domain-containing protein [Chryseobacterium sp.]|uniref:helix-turn-helix domain-containing protein n=1 Tax=Chryseobacterium sp. TaxID=1871047 RepID=UPI0028A2C4D4|nr:helix-turn-helix domain-containing protein [Chryseobacterium sp.]
MDFSGTFITIIFEALISFILIINSRIKTNYFLIVYVLIIMLDFISEFYVFKIYNSADYIDKYPSSFRFIKGPLIYLATRQILNLKNNKKMYLHFLGFVSVFIFSVVILLFPNRPEPVMNTYRFFFKIYPFYWGLYLMWSIILFYKNREKTGDRYKIYFIFLCFVFSAMILFMTFKITHLFDKEIMRTMYSLSFCIQFALLIKMSLTTGKENPKLSQPLSVNSVSGYDGLADKNQLGIRPAPKYKTSALTKEYININNKKLIDLLKDKKIFTKEDLKLDDIADILHISKNHLSQCISEGLETTFYDLINKYRIEEFIHLLHQNPDRQISEIYYDCGFRSKATFYKYFKQQMGHNPNDYRKQIMASSNTLL